MLKKTITYTDFNGKERTEDHYFNLNEAEIIEWEMSHKGGLTEMIKRIVAAEDAPELSKLFKELIRKSHGVKSDDGRRIIKNDETWEDFSQTNAYSALYMELVTNDKAASDFVNGIIPADLAKKVAENPNPAIPFPGNN